MIKKVKRERWSQERVSKLIEEQVRKSRLVHMSEDELLSEGWAACAEAQYSYGRMQGCCGFYDYLVHYITQYFHELKARENRRISLESRFSLDKTLPNGERMGDCFLRQSGDFTNGVALWSYIGSFNGRQRFVARGLCNRDSHDEIKKDGRFSETEYRNVIAQLKEKFRDWDA